jgi:hypothetical protein
MAAAAGVIGVARSLTDGGRTKKKAEWSNRDSIYKVSNTYILYTSTRVRSAETIIDDVIQKTGNQHTLLLVDMYYVLVLRVLGCWYICVFRRMIDQAGSCADVISRVPLDEQTKIDIPTAAKDVISERYFQAD